MRSTENVVTNTAHAIEVSWKRSFSLAESY